MNFIIKKYNYSISVLLTSIIWCPQAFGMRGVFNAPLFRQFMARQYTSSAHMDINQAFRVLGFSSVASLNDVRKKYRELMKAHHPDITKNAVDKEKVRNINQAYTLIKEFLENKPHSFAAQQGSQQTNSTKQQHARRNTYARNGRSRYEEGWSSSPHNYRQQQRARRNTYARNDRSRYEEDWSPSDPFQDFFVISGIGLLVACYGIKSEYRRRQKYRAYY